MREYKYYISRAVRCFLIKLKAKLQTSKMLLSKVAILGVCMSTIVSGVDVAIQAELN